MNLLADARYCLFKNPDEWRQIFWQDDGEERRNGIRRWQQQQTQRCLEQRRVPVGEMPVTERRGCGAWSSCWRVLLLAASALVLLAERAAREWPYTASQVHLMHPINHIITNVTVFIYYDIYIILQDKSWDYYCRCPKSIIRPEIW